MAAKKRKVRVVPRQHRQASHSSSPARDTETSESLARRARNNFSLLTTLGAGRIDPFNIYNKPSLGHDAGNQPLYVHEMVDHTINSSVKAYIPSDATRDFSAARSDLMNNMMSQPLVWYSTLMSSMTHHAFVRGETIMPKDQEIIRLSYRSKTLELLQKDIRDHGGMPSEQGLLAISTLIVHGGAKDAAEKFTTYDDFNARKAFGKANDMHYYSAIYLDTSHWPSLAHFVKLRGGAANVQLAPMAGVFAMGDACIAWRTLSKPKMETFVPTSMWIEGSAYRPDTVAVQQEKRYLSALPTVPHTDAFAKLYECLQHTRSVVVRYNQWQRRFTQANARPDLKHLYFARMLIMHDILDLPSLSDKTTNNKLLYDILRYALLAFNQLVLFPLAQVNDMPNRLLRILVPLLTQAAHQTTALPAVPAAQTFDTSVFLWAWMLSGMLALEHLQTKGNSEWMDELAPMVERVAIKAEKDAWGMVKGVMEGFLWLDSECDSGGKVWWGYAVLWVMARGRDVKEQG